MLKKVDSSQLRVGMYIHDLDCSWIEHPFVRNRFILTTEDEIRKGLEGVYDLPYSSASMHEVVFSDKLQAKKGARTMDIAKRLVDYGFHPYTTAFPLIVPGAMMIEPTESESKEELDLFLEAMKAIAKEVEEDVEVVKTAPHSTRVSRLDETAAARKPVLRWKPDGTP